MKKLFSKDNLLLIGSVLIALVAFEMIVQPMLAKLDFYEVEDFETAQGHGMKLVA